MSTRLESHTGRMMPCLYIPCSCSAVRDTRCAGCRCSSWRKGRLMPVSVRNGARVMYSSVGPWHALEKWGPILGVQALHTLDSDHNNNCFMAVISRTPGEYIQKTSLQVGTPYGQSWWIFVAVVCVLFSYFVLHGDDKQYWNLALNEFQCSTSFNRIFSVEDEESSKQQRDSSHRRVKRRPDDYIWRHMLRSLQSCAKKN